MRLLLRFAMIFFGTLLAAGLLALAEPTHESPLQVLAHEGATAQGAR